MVLCYLSIIFVLVHYYFWLKPQLSFIFQFFCFLFFENLDCQGDLCSVPLLSFMTMIIHFLIKKNKYQCVFIRLFIGGEAMLFDLMLLNPCQSQACTQTFVFYIHCCDSREHVFTVRLGTW